MRKPQVLDKINLAALCARQGGYFFVLNFKTAMTNIANPITNIKDSYIDITPLLPFTWKYFGVASAPAYRLHANYTIIVILWALK